MPVSCTAHFRLGGHGYGFRVVDRRASYRERDVDARFRGQLELEPPVRTALGAFGRLAAAFGGELTLFDGHRLVVSEPPALTAGAGDPACRPLRLRFKRTSYFAGAICRALPTPEFASYLADRWPAGVPTIAEVRQGVRMAGTAGRFHPLADPGTGVSICPVAKGARGEHWTVLHRRGNGVAVNPGMWSAAIEEAFSVADIAADGRVDPWATARRGAREELGIEVAEVSLFSFGLDPAAAPGGPRSTGCGYVFSGWALADVTPGELAVLRSGGSDAFEAQDSLLVRLTAAGVANALAAIGPDRITGAALYGLLGTLDRIEPGAAAALARRLPDGWL